jgi:hypothetical protein
VYVAGASHLRFYVLIVAATPRGALAANAIKDSPDRKGNGECRVDA